MILDRDGKETIGCERKVQPRRKRLLELSALGRRSL